MYHAAELGVLSRMLRKEVWDNDVRKKKEYCSVGEDND